MDGTEEVMAERMTEEGVAELEAIFRKKERENEAARAERSRLSAHSSAFLNSATMGAVPEVAEAERAWLAAKAQLEREKSEDADAVTAKMLEANQTMAEASKEAAKYSADAARAAKTAAWWTLIAALVAFLGVAVQVWQAWSTGRQSASQASQRSSP